MGWIKNIIEFNKLRKDLKKAYAETDILNNFTNIYGVKFKVDRAARIYGVMNPKLLMMQRNNTSEIFEYTNSGISNIEWIKQYIYSGLFGIEQSLAAIGLIDALVFDITQCYIDNEPTDNYLLKFTPYNFDDYVKSKKKLIILISIILAVLIIAGILIKIFI